MSDSLEDRQAARVFYTWSAQASALPLEIVDGAGVRFTTADGARWWDLGSMVWNAGLGHAHPRMRKALAEAAGRPRDGRGGGARPPAPPPRCLPRQAARRRAAGRGHPAGAGEDLLLPV